MVEAKDKRLIKLNYIERVVYKQGTLFLLKSYGVTLKEFNLAI